MSFFQRIRSIQWKTVTNEALDKTMFIAKFFCFLHVTNTHICTTALSMGPSMLPTLGLTGNLLLAERISPQYGLVTCGDVVLVRSPENPRKVVTKRVTGMEGDRVKFMVDPIVKDDEWKSVVVPKGCVWVQGDNVYDSTDSRQFGPVPYGLIQAKVVWRIWPFESFGPIRRSTKA